jgi:glycosyltransferase involved in cell wall biosynthesis
VTKTPLPRITYYPYFHTGNQYTERMIQLHSSFAEVVPFEGFYKALKTMCARGLRRNDFSVINWLETECLDRATKRFSYIRACNLFLKLLILKVVTRNIVMVVHNYYPHGAAKEDIPKILRFMRVMEKLSDIVISHSGADTGRYDYVPHPLYQFNASAPAVQIPELEALYGKPYFVVFGRIMPYKNVHELMKVWPADKQLLIAGIVGDEAYLQALRQQATDNIHFAARELTDEEAKVVVEQSQAVIICHAEDNVVVSGTFFFAMSLRKQVIALETPFLAWAAASLPAGYTHVFSDLEALAQSLSHVDPTLTLDTGPIEREYGDDKIKASLKHLYKLQ